MQMDEAVNRRKFLLGSAATITAAAILPMPLPQTAKPTIYSNRTIRSYCDIETIRDRNVLLSVSDYRPLRPGNVIDCALGPDDGKASLWKISWGEPGDDLCPGEANA